jgi:hypothetical protein
MDYGRRKITATTERRTDGYRFLAVIILLKLGFIVSGKHGTSRRTGTQGNPSKSFNGETEPEIGKKWIKSDHSCPIVGMSEHPPDPIVKIAGISLCVAVVATIVLLFFQRV